ncbi:Integrase core domain protein [compost metagenome]
MNQLYQAIGITKQAVHKYAKNQVIYDDRISDLLVQADKLRAIHPGCGVEKMYDSLKPDFLGRDKFIDEFMSLGYRLKRKKNYRRTTIGSLIYKPNLIKGMTVDAPSTIWQSDITYIPVGEKHYYAVFIIDVYTKEIVGYSLSDHMRASANIKALKMALAKRRAPIVHHSDRGSQYVSKSYTSLLESMGTRISMALTAQENAYAERINRTIKEEYLDYRWIRTFSQLKAALTKAVYHYNNFRPHNNLNKLSPIQFIQKWSTSESNKPIFTIFDNES